LGVIYKLKPEIKDYILEKKKSKPTLSCRSLTNLIENKFQIKVSKSSINSMIRQAGLSMPVGRRRKARRRRPEAQGLGAILLKAADYLLGGSYLIAEAIKNRLNTQAAQILTNTESLIYLPLFTLPDNTSLEPDSRLLQEIKPLSLDIFRIISGGFEEVRCIKVSLLDGSDFYLDSQLHTVWSTPHIPYILSVPIYNLKNGINKCLQEDFPFVLCSAPGYEIPTKEFFDFIFSLTSTEKKIKEFTLYNHKFEELEVIRLGPDKKGSFIFGLWPWQFAQYRKIQLRGEFKPFSFVFNEELYLAEAEVELLQPTVNKRVILRGCALKSNPNERIRLIILTNLLGEKVSLEELARMYLNRWPNLEEGFQDFSRKIELFTYTASSQRYFSTENLKFNQEGEQDINALFNYYLEALDLYVKWHFLPSGYEDKDFALAKERFYDLKVKLNKQKDYTLVTFQPPPEYPFLSDLKYACRRVNEREILLNDGQRLWYSL
jgi:hypothetical protein